MWMAEGTGLWSSLFTKHPNGAQLTTTDPCRTCQLEFHLHLVRHPELWHHINDVSVVVTTCGLFRTSLEQRRRSLRCESSV